MNALIGKLAIELLCNPLDIKGISKTTGNLCDRYIPCFIELADINDHCSKLAEEQVAWLSLYIDMITGINLFIFSLNPVPDTLRTYAIYKYQKIFMMVFGYVFINGSPLLCIRDFAILLSDLEYNHP